MKILRYPKPASLRGDRLQAEIQTAIGPGNVDVSLIDAEATLQIVVPDSALTATVDAVVAAHSGAPTAAELAEKQADTEAATVFSDFTPAQMTKIRAVYAGTDTFTKAQSDKLLAALAIIVHRRSR